MIELNGSKEAHSLIYASGVTRRAFWVGLLFATAIAAFVPFNDLVLKNTPVIGNHLPIGILMPMVMMVLLINPYMKRSGRVPFSSGELITIFGMMLVSAGAPSSGLIRYLGPMLISPTYLTAQYPWMKQLVDMIPWWLMPAQDATSPVVIKYMLGLDTLRGDHIPILPFIVPVLCWGVLAVAVLGAAMFLAAIFRKQWVRHERLSYPLATIPMELLADPEEGYYYNTLWRNPLMWAGIAIPALVYGLGGLHEIWPEMPFISLSYNFSSAFTEAPWDGIPYYMTSNRVYLSVIGICFFLPSQIALSLWLFLMINGVLRALLLQRGIDLWRQEPARGIGIYLGYFVAIVWLARAHLWHVLQCAWRKAPREPDEMISYRTMVVGWMVCLSVAAVFLLIVGVSPIIAAITLLAGMILITLMARVSAETGLFFIGATWMPSQVLGMLLGPKIVSMNSYLWSAMTSRLFFADLRETLMPYATNTFRMAGGVGESRRPTFFKWLVISLLVSMIVAGLSQHIFSYQVGRAAMADDYATRTVPFITLNDTYRHGHTAGEAVGGNWWQLCVGAAMVAALMVGRVMWVGFPFHPVGLLLMNSWPLQVFWFSIMLGWGIKQVLLHYGGAPVFRRARIFFIGLIVGEMLSAGFWLFVGVVSNGVIKYRLFPT